MPWSRSPARQFRLRRRRRAGPCWSSCDLATSGFRNLRPPGSTRLWFLHALPMVLFRMLVAEQVGRPETWIHRPEQPILPQPPPLVGSCSRHQRRAEVRARRRPPPRADRGFPRPGGGRARRLVSGSPGVARRPRSAAFRAVRNSSATGRAQTGPSARRPVGISVGRACL